MVFQLFNKKTSSSGIKKENMSDQRPLDLACVVKVSDRTRQLAEEIHKPIIRKFNKRKVQSPFIDNI